MIIKKSTTALIVALILIFLGIIQFFGSVFFGVLFVGAGIASMIEFFIRRSREKKEG